MAAQSHVGEVESFLSWLLHLETDQIVLGVALLYGSVYYGRGLLTLFGAPRDVRAKTVLARSQPLRSPPCGGEDAGCRTR